MTISPESPRYVLRPVNLVYITAIHCDTIHMKALDCGHNTVSKFYSNKAMKLIEELELDHIELPRARRPPARLTGHAVSYAATTISDFFRPKYTSMHSM